MNKKNPTGQRVSVVGTVVNTPNVTLACGGRQVTVTPLLPVGQARQVNVPLPYSSRIVEKVMLKAVCKSKGGTKNKTDPKIFTLRNINSAQVCSSEELKQVIKTQLSNDIVDDFEVGVVQGSNVISIRSRDDVMDIWKDVNKGTKVVLWCNGLRSKSKKRVASDDERDDDDIDHDFRRKRSRKAEEREDKVSSILKDLKAKHGTKFTPMQLRIWSEMVAGELHSSLDNPPCTSMFAKAGATTPKKEKGGTVQVLTDVATAIASALSPQASSSIPMSCTPGRLPSPAKMIEGRSKCYKQLSELNNLKVNGIISQAEYETEKEAIMAVLSSLKTPCK